MNSPKNGEDRSRALAIACHSKEQSHFQKIMGSSHGAGSRGRGRLRGSGWCGPGGSWCERCSSHWELHSWTFGDAKMIGENSPLSTSWLVGNGWLRRWWISFLFIFFHGQARVPVISHSIRFAIKVDTQKSWPGSSSRSLCCDCKGKLP